MITHDVDEALLLADRILLMTNGPKARVAEIVENTLPFERSRETVHKLPAYYPLRNHLIEFLVTRSRVLAGTPGERYAPTVRPADGVASYDTAPAVAQSASQVRRYPRPLQSIARRAGATTPAVDIPRSLPKAGLARIRPQAPTSKPKWR